jgi:hypothetical protein
MVYEVPVPKLANPTFANAQAPSTVPEDEAKGDPPMIKHESDKTFDWSLFNMKSMQQQLVQTLLGGNLETYFFKIIIQP